MPLALFLWALLIIIIACSTNPGFFGMMIILLLLAAAVAVTVAWFKTRQNLKNFNKEVDKLPKNPYDEQI